VRRKGVTAGAIKILVIMIILSGTVLAGDAEDAPQPATVPLEFQDATIKNLQCKHQEWVNTALAGRTAEARDQEKAIVATIYNDLMKTEEQVRLLARDVATTERTSENSRAAREAVDELQFEFKQAMAGLKAKRAIYQSLQRTEAFSNKYRLIGDYIYLLRQEQGLGPFDLAEVSPNSGEER
jgi:hypothetical protein